MIGGGAVPKNFTKIPWFAPRFWQEVDMHVTPVRLSSRCPRRGCSSSTLKEASSWGKVQVTAEQMVYAEQLQFSFNG
jgi:deoxyhypusine synthase